MGFFQSLKDDLSTAMNELINDDNSTNNDGYNEDGGIDLASIDPNMTIEELLAKTGENIPEEAPAEAVGRFGTKKTRKKTKAEKAEPVIEPTEYEEAQSEELVIDNNEEAETLNKDVQLSFDDIDIDKMLDDIELTAGLDEDIEAGDVEANDADLESDTSITDDAIPSEAELAAMLDAANVDTEAAKKAEEEALRLEAEAAKAAEEEALRLEAEAAKTAEEEALRLEAEAAKKAEEEAAKKAEETARLEAEAAKAAEEEAAKKAEETARLEAEAAKLAEETARLEAEAAKVVDEAADDVLADNVDGGNDEPSNNTNETVAKGSYSNIPSVNLEYSDETAVITKGMTIRGNVESNGNINLSGTVEGNINIVGKLNVNGIINGDSTAHELFADGAEINGAVNVSGTVKVGQSSVIIGDISATGAVIAGAVKGDIDVHGPVILDSSAIIMGNIKSMSVQINNGAVIEGMCSQCYAPVNPTTFFEEFKKSARSIKK